MVPRADRAGRAAVEEEREEGVGEEEEDDEREAEREAREGGEVGLAWRAEDCMFCSRAISLCV